MCMVHSDHSLCFHFVFRMHTHLFQIMMLFVYPIISLWASFGDQQHTRCLIFLTLPTCTTYICIYILHFNTYIKSELYLKCHRVISFYYFYQLSLLPSFLLCPPPPFFFHGSNSYYFMLTALSIKLVAFKYLCHFIEKCVVGKNLYSVL